MQRSDVRAVVVGHLLVVGPQEPERFTVPSGGRVVPGRRLVAVVGEVLPRGRRQQLQEGHLHHVDGTAFHVQIGELGTEVPKTRQDSASLLGPKGITSQWTVTRGAGSMWLELRAMFL